MASMNLDPSSALAEKYKGNRQVLEAAVLGRGADANIDPYSALRALQKLNVADKYEQMQKAMAGQPNPPSIAQQTVAQAQQPVQAPQAPQQLAQAPQATQGLGAMPVPEDTFNMAGGGIVAFAAGDEVPDAGTDLDNTQLTPEGLAQLASAQLQLEEIERRSSEPSMTPEQRRSAVKDSISDIKEYLGGDEYYADTRKRLTDMETERAAGLGQAKGLAALQAAAALSQGSDLIRGLGAAGAAFGTSYGKSLSESEQDRRNIIKAQMELADAQRKEKLSLYNAALSGLSDQDKATMERYKLGAELARAQAAIARAGRAPAGRGPNADLEQVRILTEQFLAKNPGMSRTEAEARAVTAYQGLKQQSPRFKDLAEIRREALFERLTNGPEWRARVAKIGKEAAMREVEAKIASQPEGTFYEDIYREGTGKPETPPTSGNIPPFDPASVRNVKPK